MNSPYAVLCGLSYFGTVFMMRSLHTALIGLTVITITTIIPFALLEKSLDRKAGRHLERVGMAMRRFSGNRKR
jgi:hypothetical protein